MRWKRSTAIFTEPATRSNQDPLNFPIKVTNRLANLLSMSERGDGRPASEMYAVFEIMVERLDALLRLLDGVWGEELEAVIGVLRSLGVEQVEGDRGWGVEELMSELDSDGGEAGDRWGRWVLSGSGSAQR